MSSFHRFFPLERTDLEGRKLGVWDYACDADGKVFVTGYCAGWFEETEVWIIEEWGAHLIDFKLRHQERRRKFFDKYHSDGHSTAREACLCHREYMLDQELVFTLTSESTRCVRDGCGREAEFLAEFIGVRLNYLVCAFHADRHSIDIIHPMECLPDHRFNF